MGTLPVKHVSLGVGNGHTPCKTCITGGMGTLPVKHVSLGVGNGHTPCKTCITGGR